MKRPQREESGRDLQKQQRGPKIEQLVSREQQGTYVELGCRRPGWLSCFLPSFLACLLSFFLSFCSGFQRWPKFENSNGTSTAKRREETSTSPARRKFVREAGTSRRCGKPPLAPGRLAEAAIKFTPPRCVRF